MDTLQMIHELCMHFLNWLISLRVIILKFIHVVAHTSSSFFFLRLSNIPLYRCTIMYPFI